MELDASDGTIELPEDVLERHGERFRLVEHEDRLLLLPVPDDPLAALREAFADVDASARQLRDDARSDAIDRAGERSWRDVAGIWSDAPEDGPALDELVQDGRERSRERPDGRTEDPE